MKALVIGGTSGFGEEISKTLLKNGYEVISIGRKKNRELGKSYSCDVGNLLKLKKIINGIQRENREINLVVCAAGFARAKSRFSKKDWKEHFIKNTGYVALVLTELTHCFSNGTKIITIGSQWSYKTGLKELEPYIFAKQSLRALTEDYALKNPGILINHYCVPAMDTPQYQLVKDSFKKTGKEEIIKGFMNGKLANYKVIAKNLIDLAIKTKESGKTFVIDSKGKIALLIQS